MDNSSPVDQPTPPAPTQDGAANERMQAELHKVLALNSAGKPAPTADAPAEPQPTNNEGFVGSLLHNAAYVGIQETTKAVVQIADQATGGHAADGVNIISKPLASEYKSAEWYGEQFGGAVGKLAPFLAAFAITRKASARLGMNVAMEGLGESTAFLTKKNLTIIGQSGVAGMASEMVFTPNHGAKEGFGAFAAERMKNGIIGGVDMAALTAGTIGLKHLSTGVAKESPLLGAVLRNPAAGAAISGYPIGMLSADMHAGLFEGRFATAQEREQSAYSMAVVGLGLGAVHGKMTEHTIDRAKNPTITDVLTQNVERGYQRFDNFMASINPGLMMENRLAYATAGRTGLQSRAMQGTMRDLSNAMFRDGDSNGGATTSGEPAGRPGRRGGGDKSNLAEREAASEANNHVKASKALTDLGMPEIADFVSKDRVLKNQKVVRSLGGEGNDSPAILELAPSKEFPDGAVLKVTIAEGGWQNNWGKRSFDAELLSPVHEVELNGTGFSGTANVYVQEIVDVAKRYDPSAMAQFDSLLEASGLEMIDPGSGAAGQMGISRRTGKLVLIDYPSVDKGGLPDTLKQLIEGAEGQEAAWNAENENIKRGKVETEDHGDHMSAVDIDRETARQAGIESGKFTPNELDILSQINMGESPKDVMTYYALIEGKTLPNGMPDMKVVKPLYDKLVRRAQAAGVLEKSGKKAKMGGDDDY